MYFFSSIDLFFDLGHIYIFFFVSAHLLHSEGQSLRYSPEQGYPTSMHCDAVCGGGVPEGTMPLAELSTGFQSLPQLPTSKVGPSGADSWVGRFVYVLGPCGSLP